MYSEHPQFTQKLDEKDRQTDTHTHTHTQRERETGLLPKNTIYLQHLKALY